MTKPMTNALSRPALTKAMGALAALVMATSVSAPAAMAASEGGHEIHRQAWSFSGVKGRYDKAQLQRGFQVYQTICAACHGLNRLSFRNLVQPGGPEFSEEAVKALAAEWPNKIVDGPDDTGKMFERAPKLSDRILGPFKNEKEARAAMNGALPLDLSVIAKARNVHYTGPFWYHPIYMLKDIVTGYQEGGSDYLYALLTGYSDTIPEGVKVADGMYYNTAFPGQQLSMPPPLAKDNFVKYQDETGSLEDNARDVSAFLAWAADPSLNERKSTGWLVMLYLLVTTVLLFIGKKRIWSKIPH